MIGELPRWPARTTASGSAPRLEDEHGVHALLRRRPSATPTTAESRTPAMLIQHALDVFRKDVQPFGRDDHFLLAPADEQLAVGADLADVAGVEPAVLERARGFLGGVEVAGRDVLAADEDLAVGGDLHLDAGDRLADRSPLRAERMVQA